MRVLRTVTAFLAWSLIVVAVAAGASFAVDSAGQNVGTGGTPSDVVLPPPPTSSPLSPHTSSSRSPTARATPAASRTSPTSSPSPSPSPPSDTYTDKGGVVVIRCQGTAVLSWTVWPSDDWQVDTTQQSISSVEFTFSESGRRGTVARGTCGVAGPSVGTVRHSPSPTSP